MQEQNQVQDERRLKSFLSLCRKAFKMVSGESGCEKALRSGAAKVIIVCADASDNTIKKFSQKSYYYKTPFFTAFTKEELYLATGIANCSVIAVTDDSFAAEIIELLSVTESKVNLCLK